MPGSTQHAWIWHPDQINGTAGVLTDLGDLWGPERSEAYDVNDAGLVVGWRDVATFTPRAVRWSPSTGIEQLSTITGTGLGYARAINENGDVAGYSTGADGVLHATVWKRGQTTATDLNSPGACSSQSYGYGVMTGVGCGTMRNLAVVWDPTDYDMLPANPTWGAATAKHRHKQRSEVVGQMAGTSSIGN